MLLSIQRFRKINELKVNVTNNEDLDNTNIETISRHNAFIIKTFLAGMICSHICGILSRTHCADYFIDCKFSSSDAN